MKDLIERLTADLRWRISAAGKPFRPKQKEIDSWAPFQIPWLTPLLLWPLIVVGVYLVIDSVSSAAVSEALLPVLILLTPVLLYWLRATLGRGFVVRAYNKLLRQNERFTLAEYNKYLQRQVQRAQQDPALGGPAEVRRLMDLQRRLHAMLRQGIGMSGEPVRSRLADDADLAESIVSAYEEGQRDPLADLDARLPEDLRQRVTELEQEMTAPRRPQQLQ